MTIQQTRQSEANAMIRFGLPSKGPMYDGSMAFLEACGLRVIRTNPRRYTASIRALPGTDVLLHRPTDIVEKVADGEMDLGVSGLDYVEELRGDREDLLVIYDDLGFGRAELVIAIPETWIDVTSWGDLADLAQELHTQGRTLRIATKYPALMRNFCAAQGIHRYRLISSQGATEAAPGLGYADVIADITETGTTLRENQLKILGGPILRSQACLIANRRNLAERPEVRAVARTFLEHVEARQRARSYMQVTANIPGASIADVGQRITARRELAGLQGPTIAPLWNSEAADGQAWFMVTIVVPQERMLALVDYLRSLGGAGIAVVQVQYVFAAQSEAYTRLGL
jgi:ATP phosphoribosyltransferase